MFVGGFMYYLGYLCLFAHNGVQHILCCVYALFFFVLPVSLDCPFVTVPSIFFSVYLQTKSKNVQQYLYQGSFFITVLVAEHEINYFVFIIRIIIVVTVE